MAISIATRARKGLIGTALLLSGLALAACAGPYYDAYAPNYGYGYDYGPGYYYGPSVGFGFEGGDHRHHREGDRVGQRDWSAGRTEQHAFLSRGDNRGSVSGGNRGVVTGAGRTWAPRSAGGHDERRGS